MINTTRWRPDTCGCVLEYSWDPEVPEGKREHTLVKAEVCETHRALGHTESKTHFDAVVEENQRKNSTFMLAVESEPELTTADYEWSFDADRNLVVAFHGKGLSNTTKAELESAAAVDFGAGKVVVR